MKFDIRAFFENLFRKFKFNSNLTGITDTLHEDKYTFVIMCRSVLLRREIFKANAVEKIKTHFMFNKVFINSYRL